jgi:hypothetical protein
MGLNFLEPQIDQTVQSFLVFTVPLHCCSLFLLSHLGLRNQGSRSFLEFSDLLP